MKAYIEKLNTEVAEDRRRQEEHRRKEHSADSRILCGKPLIQQIDELMLSLPPVSRDRPWSMEELVSRLQGQYRTRPHPMNVGTALRKLGWVRVRLWSEHEEGRRVWLPPSLAE